MNLISRDLISQLALLFRYQIRKFVLYAQQYTCFFIFLGEVGGFMGLLLGGSIISIFELLDFVLYNMMKKMYQKRNTLRRTSAEVAELAIISAKTATKTNNWMT